MPTAAPRLAVLSTAVSNAPVFDRLVDELLPGVHHYNIVDESLLRDTIDDGLTGTTIDRVLAYVRMAADAGADAVLVTCSSIGPAAEIADRDLPVPVFRVDAPMAAEAARTGARIGVLATLQSTLLPTSDLIERTAARLGREITVVSRVVDGAFERLQAGDAAGHDAAVGAAAAALGREVDVLVLAQASMARVTRAMAEGAITVPVLSSPRSGVAQLIAVLADEGRPRPAAG